MTGDDPGLIHTHSEGGEAITPAPGAIVVPPPPVERKRQWGLIAAIILMAVMLTGAILWVIIAQQNEIIRQHKNIESQASRITEQNHTISNLTKDLIDANENGQDLYDQLLKLGQNPDGTRPTTIPGPPGDTGLAGRDGKDGKDGTDGLPGKDGTPGTPGTNGTNGLDGLNGKDGLNGTDGKDGAPGANGVDGKDGAPGVGVATITCENGDLTFTLTDGRVFTFPTDTCKGGILKP